VTRLAQPAVKALTRRSALKARADRFSLTRPARTGKPALRSRHPKYRLLFLSRAQFEKSRANLKESHLMRNQKIRLILMTGSAILVFVTAAVAQSSRPRRVTTPPPDTLLGPEPKSPPATDRSAPLLDVKPTRPVGSAPVSSDTTHAFQLFQQKQYAAAAREAKQIAASDPYTAAGFCAFELLEWEVHQIMGVGPFTSAEMRGHR